MADAGLLEVVEIAQKTSVDDGDHELFSHYISKDDQEKAWLEGIPATALCGKKWLPSKDGTRYPVCPDCEKAYLTLPPGE